MGSNTNNSVVVLILALVTMLLASVNASSNDTTPSPPYPANQPPPSPSPPNHANASLTKPQPNNISETNVPIKPQSRIAGRFSFWRSTVTGTVYCNCPSRYGKPLAGARVQLKCRRSRFLKKKKTRTTSSSGRFYIKLPWWAKTKHCKVKLKSAPRNSRCRFKSNINRGISGASLTREYRNLYAVGPFSFTTSPRINCYK